MGVEGYGRGVEGERTEAPVRKSRGGECVFSIVITSKQLCDVILLVHAGRPRLHNNQQELILNPPQKLN